MNSIITKLENFQKFHNLPFHIDLISPSMPIESHYHDCAELLFVKNGSVLNLIDIYPYQHRKGRLFVISGQVSHALLDFSNFSAYRILFDMSIFDDFDEELKSSPAFISLFVMSSLGPIAHRYHSVMSINDKYTDRLFPIFDELLYAYEEGGVLAENYIKSLFFSLVSLFIKCFNEKISNEKFYFPQLSALLENPTDNINISEFAKKLNISRAYLYELSMKVYGKSPKQLIQEIRIRNAKTLLTLTDKSITEIAASCGFGNPVYFAEIFKSQEGMSPSKYRKNIKKGDA